MRVREGVYLSTDEVFKAIPDQTVTELLRNRSMDA